MPLSRTLWSAKKHVEELPGACRLYKWTTSFWGEGKVYRIGQGPMRGLLWKRYNSLPYWYHLGLYEPAVSEYIAAHLPAGGVFWDLGAHAGYHTLKAAGVVGRQGQVIAVEPDPTICAICREQLALNGVSNTVVIQAAVSDTGGEVTLLRDSEDSRTSSIDAVAGEGDPLVVPATTLDELAERHPAPDFVKMDVEGAEVLALPGGEKLFSGATRPHRLLVAVHGSDAAEFTRDFLTDAGYRVTDFDDRTLSAVLRTRGHAGDRDARQS